MDNFTTLSLSVLITVATKMILVEGSLSVSTDPSSTFVTSSQQNSSLMTSFHTIVSSLKTSSIQVAGHSSFGTTTLWQSSPLIHSSTEATLSSGILTLYGATTSGRTSRNPVTIQSNLTPAADTASTNRGDSTTPVSLTTATFSTTSLLTSSNMSSATFSATSPKILVSFTSAPSSFMFTNTIPTTSPSYNSYTVTSSVLPTSATSSSLSTNTSSSAFPTPSRDASRATSSVLPTSATSSMSTIASPLTFSTTSTAVFSVTTAVMSPDVSHATLTTSSTPSTTALSFANTSTSSDAPSWTVSLTTELPTGYATPSSASNNLSPTSSQFSESINPGTARATPVHSSFTANGGRPTNPASEYSVSSSFVSVLPASSSILILPPNNNNNKSAKRKTIIFAAAGGGGGLILLLLIACFFLTIRRKKKSKKPQSTSNNDEKIAEDIDFKEHWSTMRRNDNAAKRKVETQMTLGLYGETNETFISDEIADTAIVKMTPNGVDDESEVVDNDLILRCRTFSGTVGRVKSGNHSLIEIVNERKKVRASIAEDVEEHYGDNLANEREGGTGSTSKEKRQSLSTFGGQRKQSSKSSGDTAPKETRTSVSSIELGLGEEPGVEQKPLEDSFELCTPSANGAPDPGVDVKAGETDTAKGASPKHDGPAEKTGGNIDPDQIICAYSC